MYSENPNSGMEKIKSKEGPSSHIEGTVNNYEKD